MPSPVQVQVPVPRPGRTRLSLALQSDAYSPAINAWLGQSETDVPWHNLASIVVPSISLNISYPNSTSLPSDNAATQGSAKRDDSVTGMTATHVQDTSSPSVHTRPQSKSDPAYNQQRKPTNTSQGPQTDKDMS